MEVSLHLARSSTPKLDQNEDDIMNSIKELGQVVHPAGKAYLVTSLLAFVFTLSHLFVQRKTPFKAFAEIYMTLFIFATIALGHL